MLTFPTAASPSSTSLTLLLGFAVAADAEFDILYSFPRFQSAYSDNVPLCVEDKGGKGAACIFSGGPDKFGTWCKISVPFTARQRRAVWRVVAQNASTRSNGCAKYRWSQVLIVIKMSD